MSDPTEGNTMVLYLDILVPALIALIPGLVIHSFIIVINVTDWMRGRSVTPVDLIITFLGISRMCAQCALTIHMSVYSLFQANMFSQVVVAIINAFFSFFAYINMWLTSLLSIVFCLKISNLRTRLFLYLRRVIDQRTVHFIGVSVFVSTFNWYLPLSVAFTVVTKIETYNNLSMKNKFKNCNYTHFIYSHAILSFLPLLFSSISSILLFTSLYRHITKMKMSGNLSINLETYYSAMAFVSITFIYNTIYFTGHYIDLFYYYLHCEDLIWLYSVSVFLPVLHSSYLIYKTAKLRSHMSKVVQNVIDFLFQKKDTDMRENIEIVTQ